MYSVLKMRFYIFKKKYIHTHILNIFGICIYIMMYFENNMWNIRQLKTM